MDLGRSSHIHITTWGTLSRQKKGQRSKCTEGASIFPSLSPIVGIHIQQVLSMSIIFCLSCRDAHVLLCFIRSFFFFFLISFFLFFLSLFFFEVWRRPPPAATEDNYTNTDKSASNSYTLKSWGFCRMQLATISNACAKQKNW